MNTFFEKPVVAHFMRCYYALTENWLQTQLKNHQRYRPFVLTLQTENLDTDDAVSDYFTLSDQSKWKRLTSRALSSILGYSPLFAKQVRQQQAQLIHAHFGTISYTFGLPLAQATNLPLVTTFYGLDASRVPKNNEKWRSRYHDLFEVGNLFLVEGPHLGQQLVKLGCSPDKVVEQHLGIDLAMFPFQPRSLQSNQPLRMLAAGRFTEKKGLVYAVEALAQLTQQGIEATLTIIGDASSAAESQTTKRQLVQVINDHQLTDRVILMGMQPHQTLKQAYYDHHIFLGPSVHAEDGDNEGGVPVTLIEAAATGLPIVGTQHCDIPEVVKHGKTGFLARERDSTTLARHIQHLYNHPTQITEMGYAARHHIEQEYDARHQGERLEKIYDQLLEIR